MVSNEYEFHGIRVHFPYPLYDAQKTYLDKLLFALCHGQNAMLESPTGTGKTLCLLCGVLAWQAAMQRRTISTYDSTVKPCMEPETSQVETSSAGSSSFSPPLVGSGSAWNALSQDPFKEKDTVLGARGSEAQLSLGEGRSQKEAGSYSSVFRENGDCPKIYFMSRTHSQLSQVVAELKRTAYANCTVHVKDQEGSEGNGSSSHRAVVKRETPLGRDMRASLRNDLKTTLVASRDHLCIHPDLSQLKGASRVAACQQKLKNHSCHYEGGLSKFKSDCLLVPRDIEELTSYGHHNGFCPYYAAKDHVDDCHLVFLPYEYLLNPSMRHQLKFHLRGSVLIFDEGHNLERAAEEAGSFDLCLADIRVVSHTLSEFLLSNFFNSMEGWSYTDILERFVKPLIMFGEYIQSVSNVSQEIRSVAAMLHLIELTASAGQDTSQKSRVFPAEHLFSALERAGLLLTDRAMFEAVLYKCSDWVTSCEEEVAESMEGFLDTSQSNPLSSVLSSLPKALDSVLTCFLLLCRIKVDRLKFYRMFICESNDAGGHDRKLSLWCFTAAAVLDDLVQSEAIHSLIVTSGTLSPLSSHIASLTESIRPWVTLENVHVVPKENVKMLTLSTHPESSCPLRFVYQNKTNEKLFVILGKILRDVCERVPGGVVMFFSSYTQLKYVVDCWGTRDFWRYLNVTRQVIIELMLPTQKDFERVMTQVKNSGTAGTGQLGEKKGKGPRQREKKVLFLVVIRGRFSEGLNLADDMCRCVIIVGIPYPALTDPRLRVKQHVLELNHPNRGSEWYFQQAMRAINQAIGRVIRHKEDFGMILLIDERFRMRPQYDQLSRWVRECSSFLVTPLPYCGILSQMEEFFKRFIGPSKMPQHNPLGVVTPVPPSALQPFKLSSQKTKHTSRHQPRLLQRPNQKRLALDQRLMKSIQSHVAASTPPPCISSFLQSTCLLRHNEQVHVKTTSDLVCGLCGQESKGSCVSFQKSVRCGHRACETCWEHLLNTSSCCAYCGETTRREHLEYFS